jgi:hypothetical protein
MRSRFGVPGFEVAAIPGCAYSHYPSLSRSGVEKAVESFLAE